MADIKMPHTGHGKHLCYLNNLGFQVNYPKEYKDLVKNPKYMCRNCGRVAANKNSLCLPEEL